MLVLLGLLSQRLEELGVNLQKLTITDWVLGSANQRALSLIPANKRLHHSMITMRLTLLAILSLSARLVASLLTLVGTTPLTCRLGAPRGLRLSSIS